MRISVSIAAFTFALALGLPTTATAEGSSGPEHFMEQWDVDHDGKVTVREMHEVRERWVGVFDANGDGYLDRQEFVGFEQARAAGLASFKPEDRPKMEKITAGLLLARNDTDGDGRVSRAEFLAGIAPWFASLDKDGDGAVTLRDLAQYGD